MTATIGKYAANKLLGKQMKAYQAKNVESGQDPYFAMVEDPRKPGKMKKVKKQIPAYIPEHDALVLAKVRKSAYRLDMCLFNLFGIRFGWEAVIGIIPAFGDAVGVCMALLVFQQCLKVDGGLPNSLRTRMLLNILIDFAVGLVPFLGDIADAAFKCNTKNLRLLEVHLEKKYNPRGRDERDLSGVDRAARRQNRKSGIYLPHDPPPATVFEDFDDEAEEREQFVREQRRQDERRPGTANNDRTAPSGKKSGWFSGGVKQSGGTPMTEKARPHGSSRRPETGTTRV
nr:putative membrane protein [Quercus suber]